MASSTLSFGCAAPAARIVSPGDRGGHRGLGREMMMDARAFDADLRREFAKAKTPIAPMANMGLGQIHQPLGGFIQLRRSCLSIQRQRGAKVPALFRCEPIDRYRWCSRKGACACLHPSTARRPSCLIVLALAAPPIARHRGSIGGSRVDRTCRSRARA